MDCLVATVKPWNVAAFHRHAPALPGRWHLVERPDDLEARAETLNPRYIFFPHWSWRVPAHLLERYECVCFHMTDLPYGRGGSPLQNLIARGHRETVLSALRMVEELDAGPVYGKRQLPLDGRAETIYRRAADLAFEMIAWIVAHQPAPEPQRGEVTRFERRRPAQSRLPATGDANTLYDHIRMLDAPTYPKAFIEHGPWRIEFSHAERDGDALVGRFRMQRGEEDDHT